MVKERSTSTTWTSRRGLAWALRLSTIVVPLTVAVVAMVVVARVVHRPGHGLAVAGWYALLLAVSYAASWVTGKVMDRTLPLAALLELSLRFPERAPSRLGLSQRSGSAAELTRLAIAPPDESTQNAAERILKLLSALSSHDRFTRGHAERVRAYTDLIADKMSLPAAERERLRWAALLHDIGKLRVPAALLNKPGKPTRDEWNVLQQHPIQGSIIAAPLLAWLSPMDRVIAEHHEHFDGSGYPVGLAGESISIGARIVTVADCFEAMTAVRSYNKPMRREAALAELVNCAGSHFDPVVVRALLAVPHRRLVWAMGPTAWLAGLPMVGQGSVGALRAAVGHAGTTAVSATVVAVAAVAPTSIFGSPSPSLQPVAAAHSAKPAATAATRTSPVTTTMPVGNGTSAPTSTPGSNRAPTVTPQPTGRTTSARPVPTTTHRGTTTAPGVTTSAEPTSHVPTTTAAPPVTTPVPTTTSAAPTRTAAPTTTSAPPTRTAAPTSTARPTTTGGPTSAAPTSTAAPKTTAASTTTAAPTTSAQPTAAVTQSGPAKCTATYATTGSGSGLQATIKVKNTGTVVGTGWIVTWSFASGEQKITSWTNATVTQSGKNVTAKNLVLNGVSLPGASTTFTIKGDGNAPSPIPTLTCVQA
ncbi:MAG: hypothetical protein QOI76_2619 [Frankiales bacterium]|nr:hypothetical protein [Frankiales bacterium]